MCYIFRHKNIIDYDNPEVVSDRLFKFYPLRDYHMEALRRKELFFANPSVLNDSFDISQQMILPFPRFMKRVGWNSEMNSILNTHAICSFIEAKDIKKEWMWTFYANNFEGFAIEFNPDPFLSGVYAPAVLKKVKYLPAPLNLDNDNLTLKVSDETFSISSLDIDRDKYGDRIFHCLHLTKSFFWKEENEWRMIVGNPELNPRFKRNATRTGYFVSVDATAYRRLYIGSRISKDKRGYLIDLAKELHMGTYLVTPRIIKNNWDIDVEPLQ